MKKDETPNLNLFPFVYHASIEHITLTHIESGIAMKTVKIVQPGRTYPSNSTGMLANHWKICKKEKKKPYVTQSQALLIEIEIYSPHQY